MKKSKKIKIRKTWKINPVTRIKKSKKKYNRKNLYKISLLKEEWDI